MAPRGVRVPLCAGGGGRRGHIDSQNRLWFSQFQTNRYGMYDPKTEKVVLYDVPQPFAGAYDVQFDDVRYAWGADMSTDLVQRMNVETGEWVAYQTHEGGAVGIAAVPVAGGPPRTVVTAPYEAYHPSFSPSGRW